MLSALLLISMTIAGLAIVQRIMPAVPAMVRLCGGFVVGIAITGPVCYAVAYCLSYATDESLLIGIIVALAVHGAIIGLFGRDLRPSTFRLSWFEIAFVGASLAFTFWLMDNRLFIAHSIEGDPLLVSSETWGDTALHTALSRSFGWGANYPTEYPFFANEPIKYHFGYDFFAGVLQKGGFSVLLSFNLPGALGFTMMMMMLLSLGRTLFGSAAESVGRTVAWWRDKGVWVGLIAVALLMTNQSLAFMRFIDHPAGKPAAGASPTQSGIWDALNPVNWWHHTHYLTIGPYDGNEKIAIFNTLNVYLTQTHLIVGMALVLFIAFALLEPLRRGAALTRNRMIFLGVLFGLAFWLNGVLWIAAGVFFAALLLAFAFASVYRTARTGGDAMEEAGNWLERIAWFAVPALAIGIPQAVWLNGGIETGGAAGKSFQFHFGYLTCSAGTSACHDTSGNPQMDLLNPTHWKEFFNYWLLNEGLVLPLLAVALVLGRWFDRKVLLAVMAVFVFGNAVQLSRDLGGHNHKVINLWEVLAGPFVGYALVEIASFGYAAAMKVPRLRGSLGLSSLAGIGAAPGAFVALVGVALVLIGYALPWIEVKGASVSALNLSFEDWTDGNGAIVLHQRPGLAVFPLLTLLVAVDAILSISSAARASGWPRFFAGLGVVAISLAFMVTLKADTTGEALQIGPIVTMIGGLAIMVSAAVRPEMRLSIDIDPLRPIAVAACGMAFFLLVASGLLDFMTVKNDFEVRVFGDPPQPEAIHWIDANTPKDAVFLTNFGDLYTVPTLAGRGVYLGYTPWAASAGYDIAPRQAAIKQVYESTTKQAACDLLVAEDIDYVFIGSSERSGNNFVLNEALFKDQFTKAGSIPADGDQFTVYDVKQSCSGVAVSAGPG